MGRLEEINDRICQREGVAQESDAGTIGAFTIPKLMSLWTLIFNFKLISSIKNPSFITNLNSGQIFRRFIMTAYENNWQLPSSEEKHLTNVVVNNSFTKCKVPFVPETGNKISWYTCGPTVYDRAHLGHARTYVTSDTIRRILEYLGYNVNYIMNITDVDDKIIARSNDLKVDFSEVARKWEQDFWEDMETLKVRPPSCITRVSEFIPDIIKYIEKIIDNGYAYQSGGSVYFDIEAFSNKHKYAKMEHSSVQIKERVLEGEGALGETFEKKSPIDFALWKQAKKDEPFWDSPWGKGRPGWHIECSVMASHMLGDKIDIHSGGVDLRFPHHDNEVAQSEAFFDKSQWINYFLHFGHLHIHGSKMSKSLKNFITIKKFLGKYTPRQIRLLFLMSRWDSSMNFSNDPEGMQHIIALDSGFHNFLTTIPAVIRSTFNENKSREERWNEADESLNKAFRETVEGVEAALRDNFDTPRVLHSLQNLTTTVNTYVSLNRDKIKKPLLNEILYAIAKYLRVLGMEYAEEVVNVDIEKLLDQIVSFRAEVRRLAKEGLTTGDRYKQILSLCDRLRDVEMPSIGFSMEDLPGGNCIIRKADATATAEDNTKAQSQHKKEIPKSSIDPKVYFETLYPGKFGQLDESYIPVTYSNGEPLSKSERKSLEKLMAKHLKKQAES